MPDSPSMLSIVAAVLYGFVVAACLAAAAQSHAHHQQPWHAKTWGVIALLFAALIVSRLLNIEEIVRADLRDWLRTEDMLDGRRVWQRWLIAGAIFIVASAGLFAAYRIIGRVTGRRNISVAIAAGCSGIMLCVIALRLISLHAMDRLLYGPLKLNWVGDIGTSAAIIVVAAYYVWVIRQPRRTSPRQERR